MTHFKHFISSVSRWYLYQKERNRKRCLGGRKWLQKYYQVCLCSVKNEMKLLTSNVLQMCFAMFYRAITGVGSIVVQMLLFTKSGVKVVKCNQWKTFSHICIQNYLLSTFLQSQTKSLLEAIDILQISTQGGTVCTAEPKHRSYFRIHCNFDKFKNTGTHVNISHIKHSCNKCMQLFILSWSCHICCFIALTCHWIAGVVGNSSTLFAILWETLARVLRCPVPPGEAAQWAEYLTSHTHKRNQWHKY